jgi:hypothetical protein
MLSLSGRQLILETPEVRDYRYRASEWVVVMLRFDLRIGKVEDGALW